MRRLAWGLVLVAGGCAAFAAELPPLPQLRLDNALPVVQRQLRDAYAEVNAHPNDADANGKLAMALDAYEQFASAAVCYQRAHLLDPRQFAWLYDLGWVQFKQGQYDEAASTLAAAVPLRPGYLPAKLKLAESYLAARHLEPARKLYQEIVREQPDSAEAFYGLGRISAAAGDWKASAAALEKACELFPQYGMAQYALAHAYRRLGDIDKAEEHLTVYKANVTTVPPAVDPLRADVQQLDQSPTALVQRGIALAKAGDLQAAIRAHEQALAIDAKDVQAHINLIQLYARAGDTPKAEQEYQAAVRLNPNRADCYYNYGVMMFQLKKLPEAEQAFRRAIEINPYHAEAHNNLGYLLLVQGKLADALAEFQTAVKDRPDYRMAHFQIGRILVNQEKYPEAIRELHKTLQPEDDETPGYLYALGATYARAGDHPSALRYMREAREKATARGQAQLLNSINKDLAVLEKEQ